MGSDAEHALKSLRDDLKSPIHNIEDFCYKLSTTLRALSLHPTSIPPNRADSVAARAISRYLPSIQLALLTKILPTFLPALEQSQSKIVSIYFVPPKSTSPAILVLTRAIALVSYLTIPNLLSSTETSSPPGAIIPSQTRGYALSTLESLSNSYNIDQLYWAIWSTSTPLTGSGGTTSESWKDLQWEEAVKSIVGLPTKAANAVGRWKNDNWTGELPGNLTPRVYFDSLVIKLEELMYETSQTDVGHDPSNVRLIIQKLSSLGLLSTPPSLESFPTPSLWAPMLPNLLKHLHPPSSSPLRPYPPIYLPTLFLPLPSSTLAVLIGSLLSHLTFNLTRGAPINPETPDFRVKAAVQVFEAIVGKPIVGGEAWDAVTRCTLDGRLGGESMEARSHARTRVVVGWVSRGEEKSAKAFIDFVLEAWTDAKYIRYGLYNKQFCLTHTLILALSLLPPYHPYVINLSHQPRFLLALQSYLSHPDAKIRRLGMLVAELVSERTIEESASETLQYSQEDEMEELKAGLEVDEELGGDMAKGENEKTAKTKGKMRRLKFSAGMWDGDGEGREECRWLRSALGVRDADAIIDDQHETKVWLLGWDATPAATSQQNPAVPIVSAVSRGRVTQPHPTPKPVSRSKPPRKIILLDDDQQSDPLQGYDQPSPSSSRSPSPTPSYLEELAADPTLALDSSQKKKVTRPVYIQQLVELLRARDMPDSLEMGLKRGESLIRAKRNFGSELSENSVPLATMVVGLNDPFHLDDFEERRQNLLTALVACSPQTVAPFLSEQYFTGQYSLQQRAVILTALAMGARELAGLSVPANQITQKRIDFPTKTLPPALHRKYISPADQMGAPTKQLEDAVNGVRDMLITKGARQGEETVPELAREKRLRVGTGKRILVAELGTLSDRQMVDSSSTVSRAVFQTPVVPYKDIAAECFIMPLINRFWAYFQEASTREERSIHSGNRYRGAGTGMILSPLALEKFLMTLSILLHAARHSSLFLAVLCPETLELALTIGSRHLSTPVDNPLGGGASTDEDGSKIEAQVLGSALELCLVCLDGAVDLDQGRTLAMEKSNLVLAIGEWASGVFEKENGGGEIAAGSGGYREGKLRAAAAGVVVKVSEIADKWGRMGMMMN